MRMLSTAVNAFEKEVKKSIFLSDLNSRIDRAHNYVLIHGCGTLVEAVKCMRPFASVLITSVACPPIATERWSPAGKMTTISFHAGSKPGCNFFFSSTSIVSSVVEYRSSKVEMLAGGGLTPSSSCHVVLNTLSFDERFGGKISTAR